MFGDRTAARVPRAYTLVPEPLFRGKLKPFRRSKFLFMAVALARRALEY